MLPLRLEKRVSSTDIKKPKIEKKKVSKIFSAKIYQKSHCAEKKTKMALYARIWPCFCQHLKAALVKKLASAQYSNPRAPASQTSSPGRKIRVITEPKSGPTSIQNLLPIRNS